MSVRVLALLAAAVGVTAQPGSACLGQYRSLPFCDPNQPTATRLDDLVKRVADADTAGQLTARAVKALPNIGVPGYYWGTNCIHGVQQVPCLPNGQCPTSFPAPNSLGASWNMSLVREMGAIIGKELRAYFNTGKYNMGLDSWSPTINLNRDPRWGRNVEVAGEDPLLLGRYGVAYTQGLQDGTDPKALQAVVTLKHWVAYSVESYPGPNRTVTRHNFNAIVSAQDLAESYYPAWEMTIKQSNPKGIMCSYNMLNGAPTCGNAALTAVLRNDWSFSGYITSDSDSVADIWQTHHYMPDCGSATGLALLSGTDIDSGNTYINCLPAILANKSLPRTVVDKALRNTYARRFELGLFDPETPNRYRNVSIDEVGTPESHAVSLLGARQSLILLKNERNTLPFPKGKQVAVLGPSASVALDMLGNYLGTLCPGGGEACVPSLCQGIQAHQGGTVQCSTGVNGSLAAAVALARAADHVVLVLSSWRNWGGEGADRVTIALDDEQAALVRAVAGVGKPTAAVLLNGGVLGIDAIEGDLPAIIEAFQPGIHGAQAIAEALFGDYNPGGKLPITYYPSSYTDETPFLNMSMTAGTGRTYKYYTGKPLYPFGFGLSYTTFDLQWDPTPPPAVVMRSADAPAAVYTVTVTNTGSRAGDEVVFAFFKPQNVSLRQQQLPAKQLFDFQRVFLEPGQKAKLTFSLTAQDLKLADADGHLVIPTGQFTVHITRGHGTSLEAPLLLDLPAPVMVRRFRKWW